MTKRRRIAGSARNGRRGSAALGWIIALVVLAGGAGAWAYWNGQADEGYSGPTAPVVRGPLRIGVTEAGTIEARQKVVLKCEVDERSTTM